MKPFNIFPILFLIMAFQCEKDENCPSDGGHNGLKVENESNIRIRYDIYWNYPDTTIGEYNPVFNGTNGISPGENRVRGAGPGSCWESVFIGKRKEWIYFFDADTIESLDWETVRTTERGLLERREIDLDYLYNTDFTVTYR
jgi:hypothetical protein